MNVAIDEEIEDHSVKWRRFHLKTFLYRPQGTQWLDQLPPFDSHKKKGCVYIRCFGSVLTPILASRNPYELNDDTDFDYTFLYVKKCQALLVAANQLQPYHYDDQTYVTSTLFGVYSNCVCSHNPATLERLVQALASPTPLSPSQSASAIVHPLTISLQLLALPMANRLREGLQLVVQHFPQVAFDYAKQFCRKPNQWASLLDELLRASQAHPSSSSSPSSSPSPLLSTSTSSSSLSSSSQAGVAGSVYSQIVEYLTDHVDPEAFLNLLPASGHLLYFLPYPHSIRPLLSAVSFIGSNSFIGDRYIEKAFCRHRAKSLKSNISQFVALDLEGHVHSTG